MYDILFNRESGLLENSAGQPVTVTVMPDECIVITNGRISIEKDNKIVKLTEENIRLYQELAEFKLKASQLNNQHDHQRRLNSEARNKLTGEA